MFFYAKKCKKYVFYLPSYVKYGKLSYGDKHGRST